MRALFIGGTGNISIACSRLALEQRIDLYILNRGHDTDLPLDANHFLRGDIRDGRSAERALKTLDFDVVVDWVAFDVKHVETDIDLFRQRTKQYVFISSASAYQKPPNHYRVTESTPLANPFWQYSRDKIACERRLNEEYRTNGFPVTVVRPSHTYGETWIPCVVAGHGYTVVDRIRKGKEVIVHGDGQSLWTMTHNSDFAKGLVGILGNNRAIGESVHITSDEVLSWDQIFAAIGAAAGAAPRLIHIPSELINAFDPETGAGLLGDKAYSMVFDNAKIKRLVPGFEATVPFAEGIRRSVAWFDADERRRVVDQNRDRMMDRIIEVFQRAWPG
jgi:nucleoside-diphosphate-sugar epimerase